MHPNGWKTELVLMKVLFMFDKCIGLVLELSFGIAQGSPMHYYEKVLFGPKKKVWPLAMPDRFCKTLWCELNLQKAALLALEHKLSLMKRVAPAIRQSQLDSSSLTKQSKIGGRVRLSWLLRLPRQFAFEFVDTCGDPTAFDVQTRLSRSLHLSRRVGLQRSKSVFPPPSQRDHSWNIFQ